VKEFCTSCGAHVNRLKINHDEENDVVTIEGVKYSGDLFRSFAAGGLPVGTTFRIVARVVDEVYGTTFTIEEVK
jgi:hypothetical protein